MGKLLLWIESACASYPTTIFIPQLSFSCVVAKKLSKVLSTWKEGEQRGGIIRVTPIAKRSDLLQMATLMHKTHIKFYLLSRGGGLLAKYRSAFQFCTKYSNKPTEAGFLLLQMKYVNVAFLFSLPLIFRKWSHVVGTHRLFYLCLKVRNSHQ